MGRDDLIGTIDKLMTEKDDLEEETKYLRGQKNKLQQHVTMMKTKSLNQSIDELTSSAEANNNDTIALNSSETEINELRERVNNLENTITDKSKLKNRRLSRRLSRIVDAEDSFKDADGNIFTWEEIETALLEPSKSNVKYMDLQDAIRWTATMNAKKMNAMNEKASRRALKRSKSRQGNATFEQGDSEQKENNNAI